LVRFNERIDEKLQSLFRKHNIRSHAIKSLEQREDFDDSTFLFKRIELGVSERETVADFKREFEPFVKKFPKGRLLVRTESSGREEQTTLNFRFGEKLTRQVVLAPPGKALTERPGGGVKMRVAIIIDDIGQNIAAVEELLEMDVPFTFSILPGLEHSAHAARIIYEEDREIMLHLPMEPLRYPDENPGELALMVHMNSKEIQGRVKDLLDQVPHTVGVNNHMGSRFTQDREKISAMLSEIKKRGLFFIDSLTISGSAAYEESLRLGVRAGKRDLFLDHVDRTDAVSGQIDKLIQMANRRGSAIAICHPRNNTIKALRKALKQFRSQGIEIVPASELIG
jgi:polysaccharide deacetylase 2 family uncharacterized protein YibQ